MIDVSEQRNMWNMGRLQQRYSRKDKTNRHLPTDYPCAHHQRCPVDHPRFYGGSVSYICMYGHRLPSKIEKTEPRQ